MKSLRNKDSSSSYLSVADISAPSFSRFLTALSFPRTPPTGSESSPSWFRFSEYKSGDLCMAFDGYQGVELQKQSGRVVHDAKFSTTSDAFPKGAVASVTSSAGLPAAWAESYSQRQIAGFVIGHFGSYVQMFAIMGSLHPIALVVMSQLPGASGGRRSAPV